MSKKDAVVYGQILTIDRLSNTRNGNPRYALVLKTAEGDPLEAVTKADADVQNIGTPGVLRWDWVKITLTPAGRIRYIEPIDVGALLLWQHGPWNHGGKFPRREEF